MKATSHSDERKRQIATLLAELVELLAPVGAAPANVVDDEPMRDLAAMAQLLGCSVPTARATLERCGAPSYTVGDHRRWRWSEVCAALRATPKTDTELARLGVTKLSGGTR